MQHGILVLEKGRPTERYPQARKQLRIVGLQHHEAPRDVDQRRALELGLLPQPLEHLIRMNGSDSSPTLEDSAIRPVPVQPGLRSRLPTRSNSRKKPVFKEQLRGMH
jgi:hypothetical protein